MTEVTKPPQHEEGQGRCGKEASRSQDRGYEVLCPGGPEALR